MFSYLRTTSTMAGSYSVPSMTFETDLSAAADGPHTPPHTPARGKRRFERAASPASSIHPVETTSPAKKSAKRSGMPDTIRVEELTEGDFAYMTDMDLVYPYELEEVGDKTDETDASETNDDRSDSAIAHSFSRLHCEDRPGEAEMHNIRRERRRSRRFSSRVYKRSHSEGVGSDTETTDVDAMDDHDLTASARRLRRRTHGPGNAIVESTPEDVPRGSPEPGGANAPSGDFHISGHRVGLRDSDGNQNYRRRRVDAHTDRDELDRVDDMEVDVAR